MWAISSLVPARFLTLITHLVIVITIFWSRENSVKACLPLTYTVEEYNIEDVRLVVALSVTLGLFAIELAGFFSGASMFNNNQGLLCILTCNVIISIHTGSFSYLSNYSVSPHALWMGTGSSWMEMFHHRIVISQKKFVLICSFLGDMWTQTMSAKSSPMRNRHAEPPNCRDQTSL
ncbi:transmembrane protein 107 like isoform X6 [Ictalurus furcatus]|uniref:transmembrane protein 107 like isoform X6 n=1 Tax=Ictalurus furcatus TaxID=66913 RepID=UPI002350D150|nr:transmembrane protein 107 like isoform X6 [Ictalurus furcatus]